MIPAASENALLLAALEYAAKGWRVFPCHSWRDGFCSCNDKGPCRHNSPAKHPRTADGFKSASIDQTQIAAWWAEWPDANIGLRCGDGLTVLDIDEGRDGNETLEQRMIEHGKLPDTLTVLTGGGGFHFYFAGTAKGGVDMLGRGVDIRSDGGYVIAPPSNHASGRQYLFEVSNPDELAALPEWVTTVAQGQKKKVAAETAGGVADVYIAGGRNNKLTSDAGYMRRRGFDFDEIFATLSMRNRTKCQPPLDEQEIKKIAKSVCRYAPAEVPSVVPTGDEASDWKAGLIYKTKRNGEAECVACVANLLLILEHDVAWQNALSWDEFSEAVVASSTPWAGAGPHLWSAEDTTKLRAWLHRRDPGRDAWCIDIGERETDAAVTTVAKQRTVHPVREWLRTLEWDGTRRVESMLTTYFGAADDEYTKGVSRRWMIAAIARAMRPGCKADTTLVLEGEQGSRKSSALRALAGDRWFFDSTLKIGDKDAYQAERGKWIIELGELNSVNKADPETLKAYLTEQTPTYRGSYERRSTTHPRSCLFVGTTNGDEYLRDTTGNRRFWPVKCGLIRYEEITRDRDQLWAEALHLFEAGMPWWVDTPEFNALCAAGQDRRMQTDAWEPIIRDWLMGKSGPVTIGDVLTGPIGLERGKIGRAEQMRAASILKRLGRHRRFDRDPNGTRTWRYHSNGASVGSEDGDDHAA